MWKSVRKECGSKGIHMRTLWHIVLMLASDTHPDCGNRFFHGTVTKDSYPPLFPLLPSDFFFAYGVKRYWAGLGSWLVERKDCLKTLLKLTRMFLQHFQDFAVIKARSSVISYETCRNLALYLSVCLTESLKILLSFVETRCVVRGVERLSWLIRGLI